LSTDAVNKSYADSLLTSNMAYMVFSITMGDPGVGSISYTSTNNFITSITYTSIAVSPTSKGYFTVNVDSTKIFGGDDYYILTQWRGLRATPSDLDNDLYTTAI